MKNNRRITIGDRNKSVSRKDIIKDLRQLLNTKLTPEQRAAVKRRLKELS